MLNLNNLTLRQRNIASVYLLANDLDIQSGLNWYTNANQICQRLAARYNYTTSQVCGIMAALSPGCSWKVNIIYCERLLQSHKDGLTLEEAPRVGSYGMANKKKAWAIAEGQQPLDVLGGFKVRAFFTCLDNPLSSEVCIDRHAASVAEGKPLGNKFGSYTNTEKKYNALADDYNTVAHMLEIKGHQLQAITWVVWRRVQNNKVDSFM